MPPLYHWIVQYLVAVVSMAALLTGIDMMGGETLARALRSALAWSAIASALFIGSRYRNTRRGSARAVCDTLDKK